MRRPADPLLHLATGTVDLARERFLRDDGALVRLTSQEARLLAHLAARPGRDVDRDELLVEVWGHRGTSLSRAVDATVGRLRRKIERDPSTPEQILTVHGRGYRLVPAGDAPEVEAPPPRPPLELGDRRLDLGTGVASDGVRFTPRERLALERLLKAETGWVSAERLGVAVGLRQHPAGSRDALSTLVYRLRQKIEPDPRHPRFLESDRTLGYRLAVRTTPAPVLPRAHVEALDSAARHLRLAGGVRDCVIYLRVGERLHQVAAAGPKRAGDGSVLQPRVQSLGEGLVGVAAATASTVRISDVRDDVRYVADLLPARSELAVPILAHGRVVGVIDSEDPAVGHHTARHEAIFVSLAAIAAAAFPRGNP